MKKDNLLNSTNPHILYHQTDPSNISSNNNNQFYNTSTNFRTNLYKNKFKNINVSNNKNKKFNSTSESFNKQKIVKINEIKKMTKEQIQKYIIYLKNNLNSSYYANNEINIEYNKLLSRLRQINESISFNNELYNKLNNSYKSTLEKNKKGKNIYINMIDQYQLYNNKGDNKYYNLNQIINSQENDIIKLINENNKLTIDINNKKYLINKLQNIIELMKYKKIQIDLIEEKNKILSENKAIKIVKNKNEELKLDKDKLKNALSQKENEYEEIIKIKNNLYDKIKSLTNGNNNEIIINNNLNNSFNLENIKNNINKDFIKDKNINKNEKYYYTINDFNEQRIKEKEKNNLVLYYQKLIEKENKKSLEIKEKFGMKTNELKNIKNYIIELKEKNKKEISSLSKYIDESNLNNEKIINEAEQRKKSILEQKQILLNYNQKFRESLLYKNALIIKIKEIKKENEELELSIKQKKENTKIFNIKTIKAGKIENKNSNIKSKIKYNLTEPYFNKCKKFANIKIKLKSLSYNNIFKYNKKQYLNKKNNNQNSKLNILPNQRSGKFIYTIEKDGKLLAYGIDLKTFIYINTLSIKGWQTFYMEYKNNSDGSLLLNTLEGLFILTGDNYNKLFYYSQSKNTINMVKSFNTNYKFGGILLTKERNKIILLGGLYTNSVILFNIQNNEVIYLPDLIQKRINSCYNMINNRYLISFFGKGNNTIEYLDLNNNNINNSWKILNYQTNGKIFKELSGHIGFNIDNNAIVIVGGRDNDNIIIFYFQEKFLDMTNIKVDLSGDNNIKELIFEKEKCYNVINNEDNDNKYKEIIGMDNEGNVHCFNQDYAYTIFVS